MSSRTANVLSSLNSRPAREIISARADKDYIGVVLLVFDCNDDRYVRALVRFSGGILEGKCALIGVRFTNLYPFLPPIIKPISYFPSPAFKNTFEFIPWDKGELTLCWGQTNEDWHASLTVVKLILSVEPFFHEYAGKDLDKNVVPGALDTLIQALHYMPSITKEDMARIQGMSMDAADMVLKQMEAALPVSPIIRNTGSSRNMGKCEFTTNSKNSGIILQRFLGGSFMQAILRSTKISELQKEKLIDLLVEHNVHLPADQGLPAEQELKQARKNKEYLGVVLVVRDSNNGDYLRALIRFSEGILEGKCVLVGVTIPCQYPFLPPKMKPLSYFPPPAFKTEVDLIPWKIGELTPQTRTHWSQKSSVIKEILNIEPSYHEYAGKDLDKNDIPGALDTLKQALRYMPSITKEELTSIQKMPLDVAEVVLKQMEAALPSPMIRDIWPTDTFVGGSFMEAISQSTKVSALERKKLIGTLAKHKYNLVSIRVE
eukprot:m.314549 g.314549  ORF g.314549 m.314549 type:complete len:488 (-) comp16494_c3_seq2:163-1626(-)